MAHNHSSEGRSVCLILFGLWLVMFISGVMLVQKARLKTGISVFLTLLQIYPLINLILLLTLRRRINDNARAIQALKPIAKKSLQMKEQKEQELIQHVESGGDVEPEVLQEYQALQKKKEEYGKSMEKKAETAKRGNIIYALLGIAVTILIAAQGKDLYGSGRGYFKFFGVKLSSGAFTMLILAFVVYDIFALISALKKK